MNDFDSDDLPEKAPEPELKTESAGDGGDSSRRTRVGAGGGSQIDRILDIAR